MRTPVPSVGLSSRQKTLCLCLREQVPGIPSGDLNQPQGEEKGCEARPLGKLGDATFSVALALDALDPA